VTLLAAGLLSGIEEQLALSFRVSALTSKKHFYKQAL
jgi:hypothetical protein